METVLARRVEAKQQRESPMRRRLMRVPGVIAVTLALFFVLKAAALAQGGIAFAAPPAADAGAAALIRFWLLGADPVTRALATTLGAAL